LHGVVAGEPVPMLNDVRMRIAQVADLVRSNGWSSLFKEVVFLKRTAIVVEKDLSELTERSKPLTSAKLKLLEIDKDMLSSGVYRFAVASRYLKALNYLKHGWGGYALARDNVVVGDTWHYVAEAADDARGLHEDLQRFGFRGWSKDYVYTFDIFVAPHERKGGISAAFQNSAMLALRSKGYTRAYGFYWADNIQAQWCTRVTNKWKEVRAFSVSRCLMFKRVVPLRKDQAAHQKEPSWLQNIPIEEEKGI
jgi:GNAT superfamily N-acetyltransferase